MRLEFIGILILFLFLISFGIQSAFGDKYGTLGIRHSDNPVVCIFEPDPLYTDRGVDIINAAYASISLWQEGLFEYSPDGNWRFLAVTIPLEDHKYKNASQFPACNILIAFEYTNEETRSLGYTYLDFSKSYHKYAHIVLFTHDLKITHHYDVSDGGGEQAYVKSTFEIKPFSVVALQNIITHEFGHALGLGHYKITDYPIYTNDRPWVDASIMYYSINPSDNEVAKPKYVDIKMVETIYKKDGFGGSVSPPLKVGYYTAGDLEICTHKCNIFRQ
jgi:hypothetical protein